MADAVYKSGVNVLRATENAFVQMAPQFVSSLAGPLAGAATSVA